MRTSFDYFEKGYRTKMTTMMSFLSTGRSRDIGLDRSGEMNIFNCVLFMINLQEKISNAPQSIHWDRETFGRISET